MDDRTVDEAKVLQRALPDGPKIEFKLPINF
jgi:hypothetical protein